MDARKTGDLTFLGSLVEAFGVPFYTLVKRRIDEHLKKAVVSKLARGFPVPSAVCSRGHENRETLARQQGGK